LALMAASISMNSYAGDALLDALTGGKPDFSFRLRFERVDDKSKADGLQEADAFTARTTLGYKTGEFANAFGYIEFENVTGLSEDSKYNDGVNGLTHLPTIADAGVTEVNQAYLGIKLRKKTLIEAGRRIITPRKAPFHRYLGTVLWRNNWQTQDAVTLTNTYYEDTEILLGYIWNNNTIFGTNRAMKAPIANVRYGGLAYAVLEAYYYDLAFVNADALSTETYGLRASGRYPVGDKASFIYTGEFAMQTEGGNAPVKYDADYYLLEAGIKMPMGGFIESVTAKASYEVLESDGGTAAFRTPLATGHAFQGWADNFLATPAAGIEDTYFTVVATGKYDTKLIVSYHMLEAETGGFDYGDELDIWFTKKFNENYTIGLKSAAYAASSDAGNARATDLTKYWAYFEFKY